MHDFLHVEHLFFDLPDLPSDFKYCVKIVKYVQITLQIRSLIFLKLYPKIVKNAYLRIPIFKISRGSIPPDPPRGGEGKPSP